MVGLDLGLVLVLVGMGCSLSIGWYGSWSFWFFQCLVQVLVGMDLGLVLTLFGMGSGLGISCCRSWFCLGGTLEKHYRTFFPETLCSETLLHSQDSGFYFHLFV